MTHTPFETADAERAVDRQERLLRIKRATVWNIRRNLEECSRKAGLAAMITDAASCPPKRILKRRQWMMSYYEDAESLDENGPLDLPAIMAQSD